MISLKYLNPKNDVAFKKIFGEEKNKDILVKLINEVLKGQLHSPIKDVRMIVPTLPPVIEAQKQSIVDILCYDQDGCQYIVEMQVAKKAFFLERVQYYASMAFVSQLGKGQLYQDLKEIFFIAFTDFVLFPEEEAYKNEHKTLNTKSYRNSLNKLRFTFIEFPKFRKVIKRKEIATLTLEEKFYYFLSDANTLDDEKLEELLKDKTIRKAFDILESHHWSRKDLFLYDAEDKGVWREYASGIEGAREEGEKRGVEQTIKDFHKGGISVEKIATIMKKSAAEIKQIIEEQ